MATKHKLLIIVTAVSDSSMAMARIQNELSAFIETLDGYIGSFTEIKCMQTVEETAPEGINVRKQ